MSDRPSGLLLSACGDPANGNLRILKLTFDDSAIASKRDLVRLRSSRFFIHKNRDCPPVRPRRCRQLRQGIQDLFWFQDLFFIRGDTGEQSHAIRADYQIRIAPVPGLLQ